MADVAGVLSPDDVPLGTYFSFERYAEGSGLSTAGSPEEVLSEIFVERSADATVGEPFGEALTLESLDKLVIDPSSVAATYRRPDGVTLMLGEFDVEGMVERTEAIIEQVGVDETVTVTSESDGDFQRLSLPDADPSGDDDEPSPARMIPGLKSSESIAVSDDRLVVLPQELGIAEALADDSDQSPLDDDAKAVTSALDEAQVYAAFISLAPVTPDGGEEALAGGFGTGFVEGDEHAYTVLVHEDDAAAESNGEAVATIMDDDADCSGEVQVQLDGGVMVASCPVETAGWAKNVAGRVGLGPFSFK